MPALLRVAADKARRRHLARFPAPEIDIIPAGGTWSFESPYVEEEEWWQLIGEAFGTRSKAVCAVFVGQLAMLVEGTWEDGEEGKPGRYRPEECEMQAAISIVAGLKPRNEAEAAFAASIVATHFASMKLAAQMFRQSYTDPRTVASLASIQKAYAQQMAAFNNLRGKKPTRQTFVVKKESHVHYHDERHLHLREGGRKSGGQPDAATGERAHARDGAGATEERPALPSPDTGGEIVLFPCGEGEAGLPDARRRQRVGRAKGAG